jgi:crotonobetainyl-CoA:carnitine CoA-transferase CaiB-like acyl-CoA transferase
MGAPLEGIRVVEVANWTFVPAAGAALADLGADVIKIEPPGGDPQRALQNRLNVGEGGPNPFVEIPNRGKRSMTVDLTTEGGREILLRIVAGADVFITSYLPAVRTKLRIDIDDVRAVNPAIIYVRGTGWGAEGPMADVGGYDLASAWATSGMAFKMSRDEPMPQPPAFFDLQGANTIAGAIGIALFTRERTGEPSIIDVSLMNVAMWALAPDIVGAASGGDTPAHDRLEPRNPLVNWYRTNDDRWVYLVCLQPDRFWNELCTRLGCAHLLEDERFADAAVRRENGTACVKELDAVFGAKSLHEVERDLADFTGVWAPVLRPSEVHRHRQVGANGFLPATTATTGDTFRLVAVPMQFDGHAATPSGPAPELGQHTEEVMLEAGFDWEQISAFRAEGGLG